MSSELKNAMKSKNTTKTATLRLILAAIKDRDIAVRSDGNPSGIGDEEVMKVLETMIKQRRESIGMYEKGGRPELADREASEIEIIQSFLPEQMPEAEVSAAIEALIRERGASSLKDMGPLMAALRQRYAGRMDFGQASAFLKTALSG
ncbi:MAG: GatB/YqeY domain-containing protein [Rhodospirillaceae bacterium]